MANAPYITNAAAIVMCDALVDLIDVGTTGEIVIYGDTRPTDADTAIGAQTLLATLVYSATAFGAASDAGPGAVATAGSITDDTSCDATDTATWFRITDGNNLAIMDGTVGTSGADMNFNTVAFTAGSTISVTAQTITQPES